MEANIKRLHDVFGSSVSLEQIASTYNRAGKDVNMAAEILYDADETASSSHNSVTTEAPFNEETILSSQQMISESRTRNKKSTRKKFLSVSTGTVSSFIGQEYMRQTNRNNYSRNEIKAVKRREQDILSSESFRKLHSRHTTATNHSVTEPSQLNMVSNVSSISNSIAGEDDSESRNKHSQSDLEDFLLKMLGSGFLLTRDVVQHALDKCGYDMQKSMEELLDVSVDSNERSNCNSSEQKVNASPEVDPCSRMTGQASIMSQHSYEKKELTLMRQRQMTDDKNQLQFDKGGSNLHMEVLGTLFCAPKRSEECPERRRFHPRKSVPYGSPILKPPNEPVFIAKNDLFSLQMDFDDVDANEDDCYHRLRKAVKEYRNTMKDYYKAAIDAFVRGDKALADKLMEEGHLFHERASAADNESSQKIFEIRNENPQEEILLDLHNHGIKEALRSLRFHLSKLAGLPLIKFLKVVLESSEHDATKGARKKYVINLLRKESIAWTEYETGTILIPLDKIDPEMLSFSKP